MKIENLERVVEIDDLLTELKNFTDHLDNGDAFRHGGIYDEFLINKMKTPTLNIIKKITKELHKELETL